MKKLLLIISFIFITNLCTASVEEDLSLSNIDSRIERYNEINEKTIHDLYFLKRHINHELNSNMFGKKYLDKVKTLCNKIIYPKGFVKVEKILHQIWFGHIGDAQIEYYKHWKTFSDHNDIYHVIWTDKRITLSYFINKLIIEKVEKDLINKEINQYQIIEQIINYQNLIYKEVIKNNEENLYLVDYDSKITTSDYIHRLLDSENPERVKLILKKQRENNLSSIKKNSIGGNIKDVRSLYIKNPDLYKIYFQEMALRCNLAAASDVTRLLALHSLGGYYVDFDTLPPLKSEYLIDGRHNLQTNKHLLDNNLYSGAIELDINIKDLYLYKGLMSMSTHVIKNKLSSNNDTIIANKNSAFIEILLKKIKKSYTNDLLNNYEYRSDVLNGDAIATIELTGPVRISKELEKYTNSFPRIESGIIKSDNLIINSFSNNEAPEGYISSIIKDPVYETILKNIHFNECSSNKKRIKRSSLITGSCEPEYEDIESELNKIKEYELIKLKFQNYIRNVKKVKTKLQIEHARFNSAAFDIEIIGQGVVSNSLEAHVIRDDYPIESVEVTEIDSDVIESIISFHDQEKSMQNELFSRHMKKSEQSSISMSYFWFAYATAQYAKNGLIINNARTALNFALYVGQMPGMTHEATQHLAGVLNQENLVKLLDAFTFKNGKILRRLGRGFNRLAAGVMAYNVIDDLINYPGGGTPEQKAIWVLNTSTDIAFAGESVLGVGSEVATEVMGAVMAGAAEVLGPIGFGLFLITETVELALETKVLHEKLEKSYKWYLNIKNDYNAGACKKISDSHHETINCSSSMIPMKQVILNEESIHYDYINNGLRLGKSILYGQTKDHGIEPIEDNKWEHGLNLLQLLDDLGYSKFTTDIATTGAYVFVLPSMIKTIIDYDYITEGIYNDFAPRAGFGAAEALLERIQEKSHEGHPNHGFCAIVTAHQFKGYGCHAAQWSYDVFGNRRFAYNFSYNHKATTVKIVMNKNSDSALIQPYLPDEISSKLTYEIENGDDKTEAGKTTILISSFGVNYKINSNFDNEIYQIKFVGNTMSSSPNSFRFSKSGTARCIEINDAVVETTPTNICFENDKKPKVYFSTGDVSVSQFPSEDALSLYVDWEKEKLILYATASDYIDDTVTIDNYRTNYAELDFNKIVIFGSKTRSKTIESTGQSKQLQVQLESDTQYTIVPHSNNETWIFNVTSSVDLESNLHVKNIRGNHPTVIFLMLDDTQGEEISSMVLKAGFDAVGTLNEVHYSHMSVHYLSDPLSTVRAFIDDLEGTSTKLALSIDPILTVIKGDKNFYYVKKYNMIFE